MGKILLMVFAACWSINVVAADKTLIFCSEGNPEYFTPGFNVTGTSFDVTGQIYDRLVRFEQGSTQLRPSLAQRWTLSNDGLTYVFSLRRGVKWQSNDSFKPTRDFNADDVLFTLLRQWKAEHPYHDITRSKYPYFESLGLHKLLKNIRKLDDYTVEIVLNQPDATFVSSLAMQWAGMQSQEYAQAMWRAGTPERIDQQPIGSGPFQFERYHAGREVVFRTFDAYWYLASRQTHLSVGKKSKMVDVTSCHTPALQSFQKCGGQMVWWSWSKRA
jgi:dipeptide transport system substrate-binding protein